MKDELGFFPHDANASHDPNIIKMCSVYKAEGYGWYWMLIEMMRREDGYKLDLSGTYTWNAYALHLYTSASALQKYIDDCVNEFHLFLRDGDVIWSASLLRRMEIKDEIREVKRKAAQIRWKPPSNMHVQSTCNARAMHPLTICNAKEGKEGKEGKDIPRQCFGEFNNVFLSEDERGKLVDRFGEQGTKDWIEELSSGKQSKGYKYKSDYAAILSWNRLHKSRGNGGSPNHIARPAEVFQMPVMEIK